MASNSYLVELSAKYGSEIRETRIRATTNARGVVYLPDNGVLRNKTVLGMYYRDGVDITEDGSPVANKNLHENSFITLRSNNEILLEKTPLAAFVITDTENAVKPLYIENLTPDQCTIEFSTTLVPTPAEDYLLTFIFLAKE